MSYQPPYTITPKSLHLVAEINEKLGRLSLLQEQSADLRLRKINRIRTIQGSLAIEGNTLSEAQITAILEGKPVIAPPREIQEARNALTVYEKLAQWQASSESDLLEAHLLLMQGLIDEAGAYRLKGVGVMQGEQVIYMAPPANRVAVLMGNLLTWLKNTKDHVLISSCVFHYEFEFIHPFADGNGRMGRLWQTLILSEWKAVFAHIPVESMVYVHQADYYKAINKSTQQTDSAPFIEFMLSIILEACLAHSSQDSDQVSDQVSDQAREQISDQLNALLSLLYKQPALTSSKLMQALKLKHRATFRQNYLQPALQNKWIEMTQPDAPKSPTQKYRITSLGKQLAQLQAKDNG